MSNGMSVIEFMMWIILIPPIVLFSYILAFVFIILFIKFMNFFCADDKKT